MKKEKSAENHSETTVTIPGIQTEVFRLHIQGTSSLICHRFSTKAKEQLETPKKRRLMTGDRPARNPQQSFLDSLYPMPGKSGSYGFPASAFKKAAVSACRQIPNLPMTFVRGAFFVLGDLVPIDVKPVLREDIVRLNGGVPDIRYRGEFKDWGCTLEIHYNKGAISKEQIVNLFNIAGFSVGVGDWRPERSGEFGRFKVV